MYTHNRHRFNLLVNVTPQGSQLVWFLLLSRANTRLAQGPIDGNGQIDGSVPSVQVPAAEAREQRTNGPLPRPA